MTTNVESFSEEAPFPARFLARFEQSALALAGSATYAVGLEVLLPFDQYTEALLLAVPCGTMWKALFEDIKLTVQARESRMEVVSVEPVFRTLTLRHNAALNKVVLHIELKVALDAFGGDAAGVVTNLSPTLNLDPYGAVDAKLYVSQRSANPFIVEDNPMAWFDTIMSMPLKD